MFSLSCQGAQQCFHKCKLSKATGSLTSQSSSNKHSYFGGEFEPHSAGFCLLWVFLLITSFLESGYSAFVIMWNTFAMNSWVLNCCPGLSCTPGLKELKLLLSSISFLTCSSKYKNKKYEYMLRLLEPGDNSFLIFFHNKSW